MDGQKIERKAEAKESQGQHSQGGLGEKNRTGRKEVWVHMLPRREESVRWGWQCA